MCRRRTASAFSLVELLVVIGVITILMALLLPALGRARASAQQLRCASILRQWGQAFQIYADQYKGIIPHTGDRGSNPVNFKDSYCYLTPENESGYTYVLPPLMNRPSWASFAEGSRPTADIWQCPLATIGADSAYGYQPSVLGYHSYAANAYLDHNAIGLPTGYTPLPPFLNLAQVRQPSVTLLMFEVTLNPLNMDGQAGPGSYSCYAGAEARDDARDFGDRHPHRPGKLGGNLMFLDGHIEWADHLWDPALPYPYVPPQTDRRWWPY